jgi:hypothetical protein
MLRSLALDYYYANIVNKHLDFDGICNAITNYFEGPEYKRRVLSKWNSTSLRSVINNNTGKSTEECLQILITNLRHLQHGLNHDLRTDQFFHNKLINACQDIPACRYACYRPSDSLTGLINDLRSSITAFENPNINPVKNSSPIDVITSLIAKIANETNHDTGRNVVSSATKKAVGLQNIPRKN